MFKDKVQVNLEAGTGGAGKVSFFEGKKPSGGIGGDGGNIYLEGSINVYDLGFINSSVTFKAENGIGGGANNLKGANGKDLIIKVPLTTKVYNEQGELILTIDKPKQRKLLLNGGRGGLGNWFFRGKGIDKLTLANPGRDGEKLKAVFELELYSDILFIGFPNAGKSSILNALTNADSKVASYAFTTLNPILGRLEGVTLMDLPGLIEGTSLGKGLGTKFVKHTKAAKIVAHLISLESENIADEYTRIREELKKIDNDLYNKEEVIVLTKSDLVKPEDVKTKVEQIKKFNKEIYVTSVYDYDSLEDLKKVFLKLKI